jgi:hypothetical protein
MALADWAAAECAAAADGWLWLPLVAGRCSLGLPCGDMQCKRAQAAVHQACGMSDTVSYVQIAHT